MPEGFTQPVPTDIWQPFDLPEAQRTAIAGGRILTIVGRLADGRGREAAVADLAAFTDRTHRANSVDNDPYHYVMLTLREQLLDGAGATVLLVQAGAVALLLPAVLNLASLLIAWGFERKQEMAVRVAVGAGRWRVARLLVTQSAIVVTLGCAAGLGLAYTALAAVRQVDLGVTLAFFFAHLRVDGTVLLASAAITGLASLVAGLLPVWFSRRADLAEALRGSSRAVTLSAGALRWQKAMVVAQTALSIVVVSAATLIGLTFRNLANVPDGFASHDRAVARITLADPPYTTHASRVGFAAAFLAALEREPALKSFGFTNLPVGDAPWGGRFLVPAADGSTTGDPSLFHFRRVSPDYLRTMAIPLVRGRYFDAHDDSAAARVAIVSAALADKYYPGQDPVGKPLYRVSRGSAPPEVLRIVGVVGNVMDAGYNAPPGPAVYVPYAQVSVARLSIVAESRTTAEAGLAAIRRALGAADPVVAASAATTMDALAEQANALPRLRAVVLLAFAVIAVVIVGLGSYGVMRQLVANREREFALRLVFGALPNQLGRAVFAQVARLTVPGVAAGLVATWALAGVMRAFVFGIGPRSIPVLASVSGGVLLLAVLAAAPSALRAMRVDARGSVTAA